MPIARRFAAPASHVGVAGDPHAGPERDDVAADGFDDAAELMADGHGRRRWEVAVQEVPIRPADAASLDPHQQIVGTWRGLVHGPQCKLSHGFEA